MNPPQYFHDLTDDELERAGIVAARRSHDALNEYRRERAKIKEIERIQEERKAAK